MLTDMTRVTVLRPAFRSQDPPCPISNQSLPSCDLDPEVPAPSVLALAQSISLAPHRSPSLAPPDTHRRFNFNLRCVSGEATEGIGRGWGGRLSPETSLLAESGLLRGHLGARIVMRSGRSSTLTLPPPGSGRKPDDRATGQRIAGEGIWRRRAGRPLLGMALT